MTFPTIALIGAGNMGSSLIGGLIKNGHPADKIWATDPASEKRQQIEDQFHIHTSDDNAKAVRAADVVIFAIKPQLFGKIALELTPQIQQRKPLVISIAAGIQINSMENWLGKETAIVRSMPNTPALIGSGATALFANQHVSSDQHNLAESILRAVGVVVWVEKEALMDTVTALSGSGPAYYFLVMEAMQEAAEELGLPADIAKLLTQQTALGASRMAMESDHSVSELRRQVTSPGGTTEKALLSLEENNIREIFRKALQAAKLRSEELSTLFK